MCTLIIGRGVPAPEWTILAANRDEDPQRPSRPPGILRLNPRVAGGSDARAGGTWLAVGGGSAVAILNRRPPASGPIAAARSRGLLALDVIAAPTDAEARAVARRALDDAVYSPFSLVRARPGAAWVLSWNGVARFDEVPPGWHVITHEDLDAPGEPRTARLLGELAGWTPRTLEEAERGLVARLAAHDEPAVCIHDGRMTTVSYALVALSPQGTRYRHGEGRPCIAAPEDYSALIAGNESPAPAAPRDAT